jgi:acyl-CoA synthetase (AMP-forming)/AMP-acid ligase II
LLDFTTKFDSEKLGIPNHARRKPDIPALIMNDTAVTFKELDRDTNILANALLQLGIRPGDRISILMHNSPEVLKAWTAAGKIGVTPIALNYRFKEDELAYIINDSESELLIYGQAFQEVVDKAKPRLTVRSLQYICSGGSAGSGTLDLDELMREGADAPPRVEASACGVSSSLIYTSGTTGRPKGVFKKSRHRLNAC